MGSFCTPTYSELPSSNKTVAGTEIPSWVAAAGRGIFQNAADIASQDYPMYQGPRLASYGGSKLTKDERQGMNILRKGAESYMPYMNRAGDVANTLGRGYDGMSQRDLIGDPYDGASRSYLEGDFQGLSADELMGNYQGASREDLLGSYDGASRSDLLGEYQGMSREDLLGDYQGATREELLGGEFNIDSAQPFMDVYQSSMDPAVREIEQQTIQAQNQARASAARSGAFGGSRLGIMEGTVAGEGAQAAGDLRAQAAREGLSFAANRFDTDRSARFNAESTLSSQAERDRAARFGAEDTMRGQFMEDRQARFTAEDARRAQAENDRSARFGAEDVMYGRYGDDREARFAADAAGLNRYETNEASRIQQMDAYQGMGTLVQDLQTQAAAGLISSGEAQRTLDQQALDLAYADYLDQRLYPQEQLNFALGALSGTPYNTINRSYTTGSNMSANPSLFGQTLAGMGGLYSAYKMATG